MQVVESVAQSKFSSGNTEVRNLSRRSQTREQLARYATDARKYPLLSHTALVERSRNVYVHHYERLCCLWQLPGSIDALLALNTRRRAGEIRWTSFAVSVGDHTPRAKDAVLEGHRRSGVPVPPSGYLDTSVSRESEDVERGLEDLRLLYEAFRALPVEQRLRADGELAESMAAAARRIDLRWDALAPLLNQFVAVTDAFAAAKRALVAAAVGEPTDSATVADLCERWVLADREPTDTLHALLAGRVGRQELAHRIAAALAEVRELETRHARRCEAALELRRRYDRADQGVRQNINEIVLRNLLLVLKTVHRQRIREEDIFDAIQEGNDGLAEAALRYRYWTGAKFSTYATFWINQRLQRLRTATHSMFQIPVGIVLENVEILQTRERLTRANGGRAPTEREVAAAMNIDVARVQMVDAAYTHHLGSEALEGLPTDDHLEQEAEVARCHLAQILRQAIAVLPMREAEILRLRFGIDRPALTLREIASSLGLSAERVRRLEKSCISRLLSGPFAKQLQYFLA